MALFGKKNNKIKETSSKPSSKDVKLEEEKKEESSMKDLYNETKKTNIVKSKTKDKVDVKEAKKVNKINIDDQAYHILIKPLITEKATNLAAHNKYGFIVSNDANKIQITSAIESVYGVKAVKVNVISVIGKRVARGKVRGKRKDYKKAIVTLKKGDSIKLYEGV